MALEAELQSRVDRSLKELDGIVVALQEVKRLADSQHMSAEQLSLVAVAMDGASNQFRTLIESVGVSGATLQSAVEIMQATNPATTLDMIAEVQKGVTSLTSLIDSVVQLEESAQRDLETIRASVESIPVKIDQHETTIVTKIERGEERLVTLEQRINTAIMAAWVASGFAAIAAVVAIIGLMR